MFDNGYWHRDIKTNDYSQVTIASNTLTLCFLQEILDLLQPAETTNTDQKDLSSSGSLVFKESIHGCSGAAALLRQHTFF